MINKPTYHIYGQDEIMHNAKVRILPDGNVKVTAFSRKVFKEKGFEKIEFFDRYYEELNSVKLGTAEKLRKEAEKELLSVAEGYTRSDNLKRARDKVFEIASANKWDYMITLTLDKEKINRYDKSEVLKLVSKWLDNKVQRRGLKYLIVPEYHKDGAIHFHGLCNDSLDFVSAERYKIRGSKKPIGLSTLRKYGFKPTDEQVQEVFNVKDFPYGFTTALKLDGNVTAVSLYMTKYITKDLQKIFGSYYKAGGKIARALPFELHDIAFKELEKFPGCKTVELPDRLGEVRYLFTTLEELKKGVSFYDERQSV